jgi:hypothetical protein
MNKKLTGWGAWIWDFEAKIDLVKERLTVWERWRCEIGWFEAAVWARERVITRKGWKWEREGAEAEAEAEKWHRERREAEIVGGNIVRPVWVRGEIVRSVEAALLGNKRERECERMRFSLVKVIRFFCVWPVWVSDWVRWEGYRAGMGIG